MTEAIVHHVLTSLRSRDIARALHDPLGPIDSVDFEPGPGDAVVWNATLKSGELLRGQAVLRSAILNADEVIVGIEIRLRGVGIPMRIANAKNPNVLYSDGGIVTAQDVIRLLRPQYGQLRLRFWKSQASTPNTVAFEALDERGDRVNGQLVLHAGVAGDRVVSWAEAEIFQTLLHTKIASRHASETLESALEEVARKGRELVARIRRSSDLNARKIVSAVVGIVDAAEGALDCQQSLDAISEGIGLLDHWHRNQISKSPTKRIREMLQNAEHLIERADFALGRRETIDRLRSKTPRGNNSRETGVRSGFWN